MKKRDGIPQIELEETEDILAAVARQRSDSAAKRPCLMVGFAAESNALMENAGEKLKSKGLDLIVANDISSKDAGFGVETNRVTLLYSNGEQEPLPLLSKSEVAETVIERIAALLD